MATGRVFSYSDRTCRPRPGLIIKWIFFSKPRPTLWALFSPTRFGPMRQPKLWPNQKRIEAQRDLKRGWMPRDLKNSMALLCPPLLLVVAMYLKAAANPVKLRLWCLIESNTLQDGFTKWCLMIGIMNELTIMPWMRTKDLMWMLSIGMTKTTLWLLSRVKIGQSFSLILFAHWQTCNMWFFVLALMLRVQKLIRYAIHCCWCRLGLAFNWLALFCLY